MQKLESSLNKLKKEENVMQKLVHTKEVVQRSFTFRLKFCLRFQWRDIPTIIVLIEVPMEGYPVDNCFD